MSAVSRHGAKQNGFVSLLAVGLTRRLTGVNLPSTAVNGAFQLFGLNSSGGQLRLLWRMLLAPNPGLRRLRRRAVQAIADYRAIVQQAPQLGGLMKLDFTILLGLYTEALGISRRRAVEAGLVETYCHLAALVDAYDDLLDTPEARRQPQDKAHFLSGRTGLLRARLVEHLERQQHRPTAPARLVDALTAFEEQAFANHLSLDLGGGLDAPLDAVIAARAATSGLLLRFAAHLWSMLLDLPPDLAASSEDAAARFGLVAQFADDVIDWTQDDTVAQNLLGAALSPYPSELAALRAVAQRRPGWSVSYATIRRHAPQALADLVAARRRATCGPESVRYSALRQFGDDVYTALLPALPAIDFRRLDTIRLDVQQALTGIGGSGTP